MEKLTEKAEEYESQTQVMQDLLDDGYLKRDVIVAINYMAETNSFDEGDSERMFLNGVLWERKRQKKLKNSIFGEENKK